MVIACMAFHDPPPIPAMCSCMAIAFYGKLLPEHLSTWQHYEKKHADVDVE